MKKEKEQQRAKVRLTEWKKRLIDLKNEAKIQGGEVSEKLEELKNKSKEWIEYLEDRLDSLEERSRDDIQNLRRKLEELKRQAALAKAESSDALQMQEQRLKELIRDSGKMLEKLAATGDQKLKAISEKAGQGLQLLQIRLEILQVQTHLAAMEARSEWEEKKKVLQKEIEELKSRIKKWEKKSSGQLQDFNTEMNEAWRHFKKALGING